MEKTRQEMLDKVIDDVKSEIKSLDTEIEDVIESNVCKDEAGNACRNLEKEMSILQRQILLKKTLKSLLNSKKYLLEVDGPPKRPKVRI